MNLLELHKIGDLHGDLRELMYNFLPSLTHLGINNCPREIASLAGVILQRLGPQLESLKIERSPVGFGQRSFDALLYDLHDLRRLSVAAEYISAGFFACASELKWNPFHLVLLELTCNNE